MYKISWVLGKKEHCILNLFQVPPNYHTAIGKMLQPWQWHAHVRSTSGCLAEAVVTIEVAPWPREIRPCIVQSQTPWASWASLAVMACQLHLLIIALRLLGTTLPCHGRVKCGIQSCWKSWGLCSFSLYFECFLPITSFHALSLVLLWVSWHAEKRSRAKVVSLKKKVLRGFFKLRCWKLVLGTVFLRKDGSHMDKQPVNRSSYKYKELSLRLCLNQKLIRTHFVDTTHFRNLLKQSSSVAYLKHCNGWVVHYAIISLHIVALVSISPCHASYSCPPNFSEHLGNYFNTTAIKTLKQDWLCSSITLCCSVCHHLHVTMVVMTHF